MIKQWRLHSIKRSKSTIKNNLLHYFSTVNNLMYRDKGLQTCLTWANIFWAFSFHLSQDSELPSPTRRIQQVNKGTTDPSHYRYSSIPCGSGPRHFFYVQRCPKQALGVTSDIFILSLKWTLVLLQLDPLTQSSPLGERYFWKKIKTRGFFFTSF